MWRMQKLIKVIIKKIMHLLDLMLNNPLLQMGIGKTKTCKLASGKCECNKLG